MGLTVAWPVGWSRARTRMHQSTPTGCQRCQSLMRRSLGDCCHGCRLCFQAGWNPFWNLKRKDTSALQTCNNIIKVIHNITENYNKSQTTVSTEGYFACVMPVNKSNESEFVVYEMWVTKCTYQVPDPLLLEQQHLSGYLPLQTGSPFLKGTLGDVVCCPVWEYSVEVKGTCL